MQYALHSRLPLLQVPSRPHDTAPIILLPSMNIQNFQIPSEGMLCNFDLNRIFCNLFYYAVKQELFKLGQISC